MLEICEIGIQGGFDRGSWDLPVRSRAEGGLAVTGLPFLIRFRGY